MLGPFRRDLSRQRQAVIAANPNCASGARQLDDYAEAVAAAAPTGVSDPQAALAARPA